MKKVLTLILMAVCICSAQPVFCAKDHKKAHKKEQHHHVKRKQMQGIAEQIALLRYEIESLRKGTSKDNTHRLNLWISKLEEKILSEKQKAEERIEKYKSEINEVPATEEGSNEQALEKMHSSEHKLQVCHELLKALNELKSQLNKS